MKILVTGAAGFIGFYVCKFLLQKGHEVIGLDNINDYYDVSLKYGRLAELGIDRSRAEPIDLIVNSTSIINFSFVRLSLENKEALSKLFKKENFEVVCNLAAQAGVRFSLENPQTYIDSNIVGFLNILECCRNHKIKHLVFASSSSVYGLNKKIPFETSDRTDRPASLYAATKKSNELMAHTYSHLFGLATTGLRFFTVYGPWGRPDMALFLFTDAIIKGKSIDVFNHGNMARDFTYIDDVASGVVKVIEGSLNNRKRSDQLYKVYNMGNSRPVKLMDFIETIEIALGKTAIKKLMPMQPGDVPETWANVDDLKKDYDYEPNKPIKEGIPQFVKWFNDFYKV